MFLFIFESIGTSELLLVGIVALIFLGPRKLPEMARKIGKMMSEFRSTTNEFKETWQREVNFEEEAKSLNIGDIEAEAVAKDATVPPPEATTNTPKAPAIKEIDPATFDHLTPSEKTDKKTELIETNDKTNWL